MDGSSTLRSSLPIIKEIISDKWTVTRGCRLRGLMSVNLIHLTCHLKEVPVVTSEGRLTIVLPPIGGSSLCFVLSSRV